MQRVPVLYVESKVDMEILMVVVMEDTVWLPGLPPQGLERDKSVSFIALSFVVTLKLMPE